jgi:hypothetical protein
MSLPISTAIQRRWRKNEYGAFSNGRKPKCRVLRPSANIMSSSHNRLMGPGGGASKAFRMYILTYLYMRCQFRTTWWQHIYFRTGPRNIIKQPAPYAPWLRTNIKFARYFHSKPHHTKHNIGWRGRCTLQMVGHTCSVRYVSVPCVQYLLHILVKCNTLTSWRHWRMYSVILATRIKAVVHLFDNRCRSGQTASDRSFIFHSKDISTVAKSAYYLRVMTVCPSVYPQYQRGSHWTTSMKFDTGDFQENPSRNSKFGRNRT